MFPSYWVPELSPADKELFGTALTRESLHEKGQTSFSLPEKWLTPYQFHLYFTYTWTLGEWLKAQVISRGVNNKAGFGNMIKNMCANGRPGIHMMHRFLQSNHTKGVFLKFDFCRSLLGDMSWD